MSLSGGEKLDDILQPFRHATKVCRTDRQQSYINITRLYADVR